MFIRVLLIQEDYGYMIRNRLITELSVGLPGVFLTEEGFGYLTFLDHSRNLIGTILLE